MADPPTYPKRDRFFAHRVCRLLAKTCAAQEIGPAAALLVTFVAHQEDACQYRRPVMYWDSQLLPLLGVDSKSTLSKCRRKAVDGGWLHYIPGSKGNVGRYWCLIPSHAYGLSDMPIDHGEEEFAVQNLDRIGNESESNRNRIGIATESERNRNVHPFLPSPNPQAILPQGKAEEEFDPSPEAAYAQAHGIDWLKAKADFLDRWNKTPNAATCTRMTFRVERDFMARFLTEGWLDQATRAMADKIPSAWRPIRLAEFVAEGRVEEILSGAEDKRGGRPGASHPLATSGVGTWLAKKLAQQAEERAKAESTKGGAQ